MTYARHIEEQHDSAASAFAETLGQVLRQTRRYRGLTLQEAQRISGDRFTASSLGSYERGHRAISLERFCDLAALYGVPADQLLGNVLDRLTPDDLVEIVVDLNQLRLLPGEEPRLAAELIRRVREQRGDNLGDMVTLRSGDLQALAFASRVEPRTLLERLDPALRRSDR